MREIEGNVLVEEVKATRETMAKIIESAMRPTGVAWVDTFNAVLRPVCTSLIMGLAFWCAIVITWAYVTKYYAGEMTPEQLSKLIQDGLVGTMFEGAIGFLYGYRSTAKRPAAA